MQEQRGSSKDNTCFTRYGTAMAPLRAACAVVREVVATQLFLNNVRQDTYVREHATAERVGTVWLYWLPARA